jgi:hypothetical protein
MTTFLARLLGRKDHAVQHPTHPTMTSALKRHESLSNETVVRALEHLVNGSDPEHPNFESHVVAPAAAPTDTQIEEHQRHSWLQKLVPDIQRVIIGSM